jgi:hypothetical protein
MTVPAATPQPAPHYSAPRRLVARHPVATFLTMYFAFTYLSALVPFLTHRAILPFGVTLWDPLPPSSAVRWHSWWWLPCTAGPVCATWRAAR